MSSDQLRSHIETTLLTYGDPLRWALTHLDPDTQKAQIEAVVTLQA